MKPRLKRKQSDRRGAALVEFAIVAPVFLLFILGSIEIGRALVVQQALTNASCEGARMGTLEGATPSDVESAVNDYLSSVAIVGANPPQVTTQDMGAPSSDTQVTVSVSIPYAAVSWVPSPWFLRNATLTATTVMLRQSAR